jgi:hypothetical protein
MLIRSQRRDARFRGNAGDRDWGDRDPRIVGTVVSVVDPRYAVGVDSGRCAARSGR